MLVIAATAMPTRVRNTPAMAQTAHFRRCSAGLAYLMVSLLGGGGSRSGNLSGERRTCEDEKSNECRKIAADLALLHHPSNPELVHSGAGSSEDGFSTAFLLGSIGFADVK